MSNLSLRPITPLDYPLLYRSLVTESRNRERFGGAFVTPEDFPQALWQGVLVQLILVEEMQDVALLSARGTNPRHSVVSIDYCDLTDATPRSSRGLESFLLLLFQSFNIRKICMTVPEFIEVARRDAVTARFLREGTLRGHAFAGGEYWDVSLWGLIRDDALSLLLGQHLEAHWPDQVG